MLDTRFLRSAKSEICRSKVSYPELDLRDISVITSLKEKYCKYPSNYSIDLYYKENKLNYKRSLGTGAYGKVLLYSNDNISVVVKKPLKGSDPYEEPIILKKYLVHAKACEDHIIPIRTIYDQHGNPFIIMQTANGTLENLEMPKEVIRDLILEITRAFECFYKYKIIYTDMKIENVLYSCANKKIHFFLGDIGSFEKVGAKSFISTFHDPISMKKNYKGLDKNFALFQLGIFMADVFNLTSSMNPDDNTGKKKTFREFEKKYYPDFERKVFESKIDPKYKKTILMLTDMNIKKRSKMTFKKIIKIIK